ncbi:2-amino-4-hydroxy-6-hydroxymethyldihydropteridine diphosphokinase [Gracilibacillus alcaliphilus]|uniref:2-amino-4-hydroxy-6- hydroxymethyldihydropteridine diphosphokinase n=1 Tax=Gracilibacillus alcaliphilus TaxID=1401441 RepID=UPI00195682B7|nr:2-amino-4-hydroxy-6-hydroxymethyldihydropteridine diphosphokinase [Gracilibacillus alcaliphilus]MBM7678157.1 2-amino-4-hydroxy-6-hydroxymethyldihydropteridine diphosphokinase [Gracilibacillus alcaliphilus]
MNTAYIALGSNIAPRLDFLTQAIELLQQQETINITKQSSIYETEPVGLVEQDPFLNMVISLETELKPEELLDTCQQIEQLLGRKRDIRWGPRTIDLDILLYNQTYIESDRLLIPHPRLHERAFVLIPLAEVSPSLYIRGLDQTISELLTQLPLQDKEGVIACQPIEGVNESKPFEN